MTLVISKGLTLDNGTRAAAIAGVSPTLDYRFAREKREIETVSLTDKLTYTGGNGTFVGSDGFIQRATTNVPRFDHDPLSRRSLGLLSEVERVNLAIRSEELDNAIWTKTNAVAVANSLQSPAGQTSADFLREDTANSTHFCFQVVGSLVSGTVYTLSAFIKPTSDRGFGIGFSGAAFNDQSVRFNSLGVHQSTIGTIVGYSVADASNGYYRTTITAQATGSGNGQCRVFLADQAGSTYNYTGNGTSGLYLWGAQLEAGSSPSTYIPTTASTVTRTADSAVIDGTGVITGTYTMVEKPAGCAVVSGSNIELQPGFTAERVMVFPAALDAGQITAIRGAM